MSRALTTSIVLLCIALSALMYNVGFFLKPESGYVAQVFINEAEQRDISLCFFLGAGASLISGIAVGIGVLFKRKLAVIASSAIFVLTLIVGYIWWLFSSLFFGVVAIQS